jgi:DNA (cytosine-5)-methyltransferase 1
LPGGRARKYIKTTASTATPTIFSLATLCSGIETPVLGLEELKADFVHTVSCEKKKHCRSMITANFNPEALYTDVCNLPRLSQIPNFEVLVMGAPCQPFTPGGLHLGFEDERSAPLIAGLSLLENKVPKAFLLENVKGLTIGSMKSAFLTIINWLKSIRLPGQPGVHYKIDWKVLDTSDFDLPQHRERVYIVGLRSDCLGNLPFEWPLRSTQKARLDDFLEPIGLSDDARRLPKPTQTTQLRNLALAKSEIRADGNNPMTTTYSVDVDSTHPSWLNNESQCLTASRSQHHGFWITNRGRKEHTSELMRIQGLDPRRFMVPTSVPISALNHMIGNGMSVTVIKAILASMSVAAPHAFGGQSFVLQDLGGYH